MLKVTKHIGALMIAAAFAGAPQMGAAQVSLDDLETRSSAATSEMDKLREILGSANNDQAMRALQIVMAEGSVEQKRIALESSLASTSEAVRRTGMEAFLNAKPLIAFMFDGSKLTNAQASNFGRYFTTYGTLEENQLGRFALAVGDYIPDPGCWSWASYPDRCLLGLTDENVVLYLSVNVPGIGVIGTDGIVRGNVTVPNAATVPYAFSVKF